MVDVIKRRITGVSADAPGAKIDMETISPASFSTPLNAATTVNAPSALTLTVEATGGLAPYTYQWYKNNNAIAGATAATYTKATTVASADSGTYKVVVHDVYGNIISSSTVATVS